MAWPISRVKIEYEQDVVLARQRGRDIAGRLGFDNQDQVRIATAVSEIARNAFMYGGGGLVEFQIEGQTAPQVLIARVSDKGPGIKNVDDILSGQYRSSTGMGLGIMGARRLVDQCDIESRPESGTTVTLKKILPRRAPVVTRERLAALAAELADQRPQSLFEEVQRQNQELLQTLQQLRERQDDLERLNRELEDTNRGVVALYAELDEKANHLTRADELKTKFLSNMSHEFRTPLNSMLALTQLLLDRADGELNEEQDKQVRFIRKGAESLLDLVNDLLDIARIEAGKIEVHPVEFTARNLFSALRGMLRPLLIDKTVNLVFEEPPTDPLLYNDEGKISQVLRNFVSNALKFTERGEVRVSAAIDEARKEIIFSVADTGIGIAPEDQSRIFEEFTQLDNPVQRSVKGFGLGLPLCRKLAGLLGGSISLESAVGVGSTFSLRVPMIATAPEQELPRLSETLAAELNSTKLPLLVVEDEPETRLIYEKYLRDTDYEIIPAASLRDARAALRQVRPAAIILDILLRGEDTWQWLSEIKGDQQTRDIPILIVSTVEDAAKGAALGADTYLVKPVGRQQLILSLNDLVLRAKPPLPGGEKRAPDKTVATALVVDDEQTARYLLKRLLGEMAIGVLEAESGAEALRLAERRPEVVFLDLNMPQIPGIEVLRSLRASPATAAIPVIVVTSEIPPADERAEIERTAQGFIEKRDLNVDALRKLLSETCGFGYDESIPKSAAGEEVKLEAGQA